jgi:hypothetical protein
VDWGAVALEPLEKGDFVIKFVGEGKVVFHVITLEIEPAEITYSW